ncbi:hypothetical protein EGJ24_22340 [Stenotrophomonas maltophilia]|uniref:hypothetical protein n=1 Tax=Stenotrophomonas maltophilia TaxID=40324 RepID=UPI000F7843D2|nr:hypothetical protein [Stenotrophomonas maltophilia]RRU68492.1 hypothetical protein EGJ24_22340 [Stenotrophomonas maltophilia]HEL4834860.1 hypothetical protein [Stenotrophomonas maltophilia]
MALPEDATTWFKLIGTVLSAGGSLVLAWRVKQILKWVVYALVAHEASITQLNLVVNNKPQTDPLVRGATTHLLDIQSKLGLFLLILGFTLLGIGMLCSAASILLGAAPVA